MNNQNIGCEGQDMPFFGPPNLKQTDQQPLYMGLLLTGRFPNRRSSLKCIVFYFLKIYGILLIVQNNVQK